ncbi:MAG: acyl-CoA dehydrogenase family protein [Promethearchaeati archaeon SRVP18_Atabeyarchaeia-1]
MDFGFGEEQKMMRDMVREFARREIAPKAAEVDATGVFPRGILGRVAEKGLMGVPFPTAFGGAGADYLSEAITVEELSYACATTGFVVSVHTLAATNPIYCFGSSEQKEKYLSPLARGDKIGAIGYTEPGAGSDAIAIQAKATLRDGRYIVNGTKTFITNAGEADIYLVFATVDPEKKHKGIQAFIIEKGTPGFSFGKIEDKMGVRGCSTGELVFHECEVPKENLLSTDGFKVAMAAFEGGRVGVAAMANGIARAALDKARKFAKERIQFGQPIAKNEAIQFMVADMATEIDAARLLTYRAAWLMDKHEPFTAQAAMAKVFAAETAMRTTTKAVQIHGGYGYCREYEVERHMRDAKMTEIAEGTSEIQRLIISRGELG